MKLQSSLTCTTITAKDSECPGGKKEAKMKKKGAICYKILSTNNIRSYNHNVSSTCLPKLEISKVKNYSHVNVNFAKSMKSQLNTKNCRQLKKTRKRRGDFPQGKAHQLAV